MIKHLMLAGSALTLAAVAQGLKAAYDANPVAGITASIGTAGTVTRTGNTPRE